MDEVKKIKVVSSMVGILIREGASAKEAIEISKQVEDTFLERCWHTTSLKGYAKQD